MLEMLSEYAFGVCITKTSLFKYTENFTTQKKWKFLDKNSDIFSYFCSKT